MLSDGIIGQYLAFSLENLTLNYKSSIAFLDVYA